MQPMLCIFPVFILVCLVSAAKDHIDLVTFDDAEGTTFNWKLVNDPVMGGLSNSTWKIDKDSKIAKWEGEVKIVPSLKAPGFCNAETSGVLTSRFNDVSAFTHLEVRARATMDYSGYKVSFAADTFNPQFASFKANFDLPNDGNWHNIAIPFSNFSNDWSPYTGDCDTLDPTGRQHVCCTKETPDVCPTTKNLKDITQVGLWMEGEAGKFNAEFQWIRASFGTNEQSSASWWPSKEHVRAATQQRGFIGEDLCSGPVQDHLKYNMSGRYNEPMFIPPAHGESLVTAICCDSAYAPYAEPTGYYSRADVSLFSHLDDGVTTFYDPVCGIPLFQAPKGRSLQAFKDDTDEHGWPSFRTEEVISENVIVQPVGLEVKSICGTHLGSYLPDSLGSRWCIDLSCVSGNPSHDLD